MMLKNKSMRLNIYLVAVFGIAILWRAGETLNKRFASLPINNISHADDTVKSIDIKSFHAVLVKETKAKLTVQEDIGNIESLFKKVETLISPPPLQPAANTALKASVSPLVAVDYAAMLRQSVRIDGIAEDGVFINGQFYKTGEKMQEWVITTETGSVLPILESVKDERITLRIGKQKVLFLYNQRAGSEVF